MLICYLKIEIAYKNLSNDEIIEIIIEYFSLKMHLINSINYLFTVHVLTFTSHINDVLMYFVSKNFEPRAEINKFHFKLL